MTYIKAILAFLKLNKWVMVLLIAITLVVLGIYFGAKIWRTEMQRQENNYLAAIEQLRGDAKEAQRIFELKIGEVNRQFPELKQQLKDMDIKLKNVETIQNVNTVTHTNVNTVLRDSTINDTIVAKIASYKDSWTDFKLVQIKDSIHSSIVTRDSLFIVLHKIKRNLWQWLRAEPRNVSSTVKNYNPNSEITFNRLIKIDK